LRRLHEAASARIDDLTAAMVEEYGGVAQFAGPIVQSGVHAFLAPRIISDDGSQFIARDFKEFIPHRRMSGRSPTIRNRTEKLSVGTGRSKQSASDPERR